MASLEIIVFVHIALIAIFAPVVQSANEALIDQTCKQTPYYDLCVSSLKSDPGSATADLVGFAIIIVHKTEDLTTQTLNQIQELLSQKPSSQKKKALRSLSYKYNVILSADIPVAIEALTKGDYKFAQDSQRDAANEANSCENGFSGDSPLGDQNKAVHDVATVGAAIVQLLL